MALTDTSVRSAKAAEKPRKISDGGGLFLLIQPAGGKLWRQAYRFAGKQKTLALGSYPAVSLADARVRRDAAKKLIAHGIDPGEQKKADKAAATNAAEDTFGGFADALIEKMKRDGYGERTIQKNTWLLGIAKAKLGKRALAGITWHEVAALVSSVVERGNIETARRLRALMSQVFASALMAGRLEINPVDRIRQQIKGPKQKHHAAILEAVDFGGLLRAVWGYGGQPEVIAALKLMALLFPRPGELRQAEWREFDLDAGTWVIPGSRMKMRREHRKPLPPQAIEILRDLRKLTGDVALVFPGLRSRERCISENTLNGALRRLGFAQDEATSHGFRASAASLLNAARRSVEANGETMSVRMWDPDAIEAELAHQSEDEVRRAYVRGDFWDERVRMMAWWAAECDRLRAGGKVIPFANAAA